MVVLVLNLDNGISLRDKKHRRGGCVCTGGGVGGDKDKVNRQEVEISKL